MQPDLCTTNIALGDPYVTTEWICNNPIYKAHLNLKSENLVSNLLDDAYKVIKKSDPIPTKIIRSGPVTVIFWEDGTKTLVRRAEGAPDDPYLAFCAGLAKKIYGNNSKVKKLIEEKTVETKEKEKKTDD